MSNLIKSEIERIIALFCMAFAGGLIFISGLHDRMLIDIAIILFWMSNTLYVLATREELETICKVTALLTELNEKDLTAMLKKKQEEK